MANQFVCDPTDKANGLIEIDAAEWFGKLDSEIVPALAACLRRYPDSVGLLQFVNQNLSSARIGMRFCIPVGPSNTINAAAWAEMRFNGGKCCVQPPEGFAWEYYAEGFIGRAAALAHMGEGA